MTDIMHELSKVLEERRNADPDTSYVAQLHTKGINKLLEKIGEEATETIIAAKDLGNAADPDISEVIKEIMKLSATFMHRCEDFLNAPRTLTLKSIYK